MRKNAVVISIVAILLGIGLLAGASSGYSQTDDAHEIHLPVVSRQIPALPPAGPRDWAMVGANPARTSWSPEEVTGQLQLAWYRPIEAYIPQNSQVIASGGLLYVSTAKGLYALNAATGALSWRFDTEMPLGNSPTVANGVLYVGGYDRKLHALDAQTGRHLWAFSGAGAGYDTNPLVVDGRVFAGNRDGKMYAVGAQGTAQQGQLIWSYQTGGAIHLSAAYSEGTVYFAANDNRAYALRASDGQLVWRSGTLPGLQLQSYWPVVYRDMVIFSSAVPYRDAYSPGTSTLTSASGQPFGNYREMQLEGIFPEMTEGTTLGPVVAPQDWAHGYPTINASRLTQYLEDNPASDPNKHKPWRRVLIALNRNTGTEFTYDSDGDGHREYLPAAYWGTGSGNRYPPLVGPDNILYFGNLYLCCSDAKGRVMGWQPSTPNLLSVTGGLGALAEPQAISAGGNIIYRNICCDRRADWFNVLDPRAPAGQVWSYDLSTLAPEYDAQTWITLPGWPRLHGWYQGRSESPNAAYHNHGDQNPIVPYQGRLYTHRSNAIFAFGTAAGPGSLPQIAINSGASGVSLGAANIQARLEAEIVKMLDAGNLRPGYYNVGQFMDRELANYFDNPGDTVYTLAKAYPHLTPATQNRVRAYLQQYFATYFDPAMYVTTGWASGAPREDMLFPPDLASDLANHEPAVRAARASWSYPPHNFYALWKYAEVIPAQAVRAYDLAKGKLQVPVPSLPVVDYFQQKPWELNAWIAGYIGFLELQELAGRQATDATLRTAVTAELNRLLQLRINLFSKNSYWGTDNFTYKKRMDVARNFIFLVPELADRLHEQIPGAVATAIAEYEYIAPYWFVSRFESAIGESTMQHLYDYHALFLAKAYILDESQAELSKYVDVPAFARGDLFYIQNLVATLEAP